VSLAHQIAAPLLLYDDSVRRWMMSAAIVTIVVALSAGAMPWRQAAAGAFRPPDLAQDIAAAQMFASGVDPYEVGVQAVQAHMLGIPVEAGYPYFPHPPLAVVLTWPIADLPFNSAALIWFAGSLALLFALAVLLAEVVSGKDVGGKGGGPSTSTTMTIFLLLLAWPPVLYNLEKGQWSIIVALLLALSWRSLQRAQSAAAGACVGAAAAVKIFPVLLAGYLLPRSPRAVVWAFVVGAIATLVPLMWMGPLALPAFIRQSQGNVSYWETWPAVTYSIHGAAARLFTGGKWAQPLVNVPMLTRSLVAVAGIALAGFAMVITGRERLPDDREGARFAAWTILLVTLNPLAMGHNGVVLALPIFLAARALALERRVWPRVAWALGVALVSIPRQTIVSLAPVPVAPWRGLGVVALPMWGTLLLFAAAIAAVRRDPQHSRPPSQTVRLHCPDVMNSP
jgi:hypothetical protein